MYIKQSVSRPEGNPGIGLRNRDHLVVIDTRDIDFMPKRNARGVLIEEDIILKKGAYGIGVYMTPGTIQVTAAAEGDPDQVGATPQVVFSHPGNELAIREFKANWLNRTCIIIVRYCSGKPSDIIGDLCNPCRMTTSYTGNKDSSANEITFAQISKGDDIGIYAGTIPLEEPVSTVEAAAATVDFIAEGQYQLSSGEAVISKIEGGSHGDVITLLGTAGTAPTVSHVPAAILLKGGKAFTASEGSQLTLKAFQVADDSFVWIEQSRHDNT